MISPDTSSSTALRAPRWPPRAIANGLYGLRNVSGFSCEGPRAPAQLAGPVTASFCSAVRGSQRLPSNKAGTTGLLVGCSPKLAGQFICCGVSSSRWRSRKFARTVLAAS